MFLTVNLITGTKARVTNHQTVESLGCELQRLHGTLLWRCQTQVPGGNQRSPTEQHQGSAVPSRSRAHKGATLPLQPRSSGKFLTSNAPANVPKCTAQLSALKPLTWNCISSPSPALHANRVCKSGFVVASRTDTALDVQPGCELLGPHFRLFLVLRFYLH